MTLDTFCHKNDCLNLTLNALLSQLQKICSRDVTIYPISTKTHALIALEGHKIFLNHVHIQLILFTSDVTFDVIKILCKQPAWRTGVLNVPKMGLARSEY